MVRCKDRLRILKELLERVFVANGNSDQAMIAGFAIVGIFTLTGIAHFVSGYAMQYVSNKVILDFRRAMFQRLLTVPVPFSRPTPRDR